MNDVEYLAEEFWENDRKNGSLVKSQYDEIKSILNNADIKWVKEHLNAVKKHAIEQTAFYKNYQLNDNFPVVNKGIILENYDDMLAVSGFEYPLHTSSTSGSTGTPFRVVQDLIKRKRTIADLKVFGEMAQYNTHERMIFFRALNPKHMRTKAQEERENIYYIDSSDLGSFGLDKMYHAILDKKPVCLLSYSSTLVELAKYIDSLPERNSEFYLKSVITIGEGISEENRILLEKVFSCSVFRRYSDMELGIMAQDNGDGKSYLLNYGSYYFECLKLDSNDLAENGEIGRIVVTDLFNYALPMIRYDTGDIGIMSETSDGFPILKEIYGRQRDCVYSVKGSMISPAKISVSMWGMKNVTQWQFIQKNKDCYVLKLNCKSEEDFDDLINKLKDILGFTANISIELVDEIPCLSSSKRRAIICEYNPEEVVKNV